MADWLNGDYSRKMMQRGAYENALYGDANFVSLRDLLSLSPNFPDPFIFIFIYFRGVLRPAARAPHSRRLAYERQRDRRFGSCV